MQPRKVKLEASIHVSVFESDPLRFAGFRALLGSENDLRLTTLSLSEIPTGNSGAHSEGTCRQAAAESWRKQ